jgi:hypothetical protein
LSSLHLMQVAIVGLENFDSLCAMGFFNRLIPSTL